MSRLADPRQRRIAVAVAVTVLVLGLGAWLFWPPPAEDEPTVETPPPPGLEIPEEAEPYPLYFPGKGGKLFLEEHDLLLEGELDARAKALVEALLAGPRGPGLEPPLPGEVAVEVYLEGAVAYLDFTSPAERPPASGSLREMLTVYSVVDTLLESLEEIEGVVLLWNSRQHSTFAGHLDTTRPLVANRELIAAEQETPADSWSIEDPPTPGAEE